MKVNRKELIGALKAVQPAVASKELVEQATSFVFMDNKVIAHDDQVLIQYPIALDIEGAVPAAEFYAHLSKIKEDEIDIERGEGEILIHAGRRKAAGFRLQEDIVLPIEQVTMPTKKDWKALKDDTEFKQALKICLPSAAKDLARPQICGLFIEPDQITATDNFRVTRAEVKTGIGPVLIDPQSITIMLGFDIDGFAETEGWFHIKTETGVTLSCRTSAMEYPDVGAFLKGSGDKIKFPANLAESLERTISLANSQKEDALVTISISKGQLTIKCRTDIGWIEEKTKVLYKGDPIKFNANPIFLRDILSVAKQASLAKNMILFSGDNWKHSIWLPEAE